MATTRPRVLQYGKMPLAQLDAELAQAYEVSILSEQPDPERFLAEHGGQFEYAVTSAAMGLPAGVVDALPNLKFVSSFGVGFDALDKDALLRRGARVGYTPGVLDDCVADLAFALLLDATRGLSESDRFVLLNFNRRFTGEVGGGHWSPLAAYHEASDSVLLMDVARYKYPPVWVPLADRVHIAILLARGYAALESRESPQGTVLALYPV